MAKKIRQKLFNVLARALAVAVFTGLVILALQIPIAWTGFNLIGGSEEVKTLAREYFLIRIWAAPAALSLFVFSGWFLCAKCPLPNVYCHLG